MSAVATRSGETTRIVETRAASTAGWGRFPILCLTNSLALVLVALAYSASRLDVAWAPGLFWLSLLAIFVPTASRIVAPDATRRERIALVLLLGIVLYLVKVLQS